MPYGHAVSTTGLRDAMTSPAPPIEGFRVGTEENPLVHPVTGERLVFRKRAAATGGEVLEFMLRMAPAGFIATPHVHPSASPMASAS